MAPQFSGCGAKSFGLLWDCEHACRRPRNVVRKGIIAGKFGGKGPGGPSLVLRSSSGKPAVLGRRVVTTRAGVVRERPGRRGPGGGRSWGRQGLWRPRGISEMSWALEARSRAAPGTSGQQEAWRVSGTSGPREARRGLEDLVGAGRPKRGGPGDVRAAGGLGGLGDVRATGGPEASRGPRGRWTPGGGGPRELQGRWRRGGGPERPDPEVFECLPGKDRVVEIWNWSC